MPDLTLKFVQCVRIFGDQVPLVHQDDQSSALVLGIADDTSVLLSDPFSGINKYYGQVTPLQCSQGFENTKFFKFFFGFAFAFFSLSSAFFFSFSSAI